MTRISALLFLLVFCSATAMQAQASPPVPKPDPAMKKMTLFTGHWTLEGGYRPGPLGPGGRVTDEWTGRMILNGFFFERRVKGKRPSGDFEFVDIDWYDPNTKSLTYAVYQDNGHVDSGVFAFEGNACIVKSKRTVGGKQYETRGTCAFAADGMSLTYKGEFSPDGKTWTVYFEGKGTKVLPAPKK
jgi:hypothetical protein